MPRQLKFGGANADSAFGYGKITEALFAGLRKRGWFVRRREGDEPFDVYVADPSCLVPARALFTMWESSLVCAEYVGRLNKYKLLIVPCQANVEAFRRSGYKGKIEVCHLGIDFPFIPQENQQKLVFASISADPLTPERKRAQFLVDCFSKAFPREKDVQLRLKQNPNCSEVISFDSRVEIVRERLKPDDYKSFISSAHIGVFPSGMEAWCIPALEFLASGRGIIVPFYGGIKEFAYATCCLPLDYKETRSPKLVYDGIGKRALVSEKSLIEAFHFFYDNRFEVASFGVAGVQQARNFTTERMIMRLEQIINKYAIGL